MKDTNLVGNVEGPFFVLRPVHEKRGRREGEKERKRKQREREKERKKGEIDANDFKDEHMSTKKSDRLTKNRFNRL